MHQWGMWTAISLATAQWPGTLLPFVQVTATDLKIGFPQMKSTGTQSSNELQ